MSRKGACECQIVRTNPWFPNALVDPYGMGHRDVHPGSAALAPEHGTGTPLGGAQAAQAAHAAQAICVEIDNFDLIETS